MTYIHIRYYVTLSPILWLPVCPLCLPLWLTWLWLIVGVFSNYVIGEQEAPAPPAPHHHLQQQIQQQLLATHAFMVTPGFGWLPLIFS